MTPERYKEVGQLYHAALELAPEVRSDFLAGACGGDETLWREVELGRKVALKLLPADLTAEPERVRRFEQEARAASALNHPNLERVFAFVKLTSESDFLSKQYFARLDRLFQFCEH